MLILAIAILICVLLPAFAVFSAWSARKSGRLTWLLKVIGSLGLMGFLTLIARWDWLSIYLMYAWWALVIGAALGGLLAVRKRRWIEGETRTSLITTAIEPVISLGLLGFASIGLFHAGAAVDLRFPLSDGRFIVGHGGNSTTLNYHNAHPTQRYALDILALDNLGRRAAGFQPKEMEAYVIYGAPVSSPCAGNVVEARDGLPDNAIGATNTEEASGNHVVIACQGLEIVLAHFRPGSVKVAPGDAVTAGQVIGETGNSGNSSEPHLHIHAVREGTGGQGKGEAIPLTFGGVFPVRNTTIDG